MWRCRPQSACVSWPGCCETQSESSFRPKDIADLQRLIGVRGAALDVRYVRAHIAAMMGEDDERIARWDALVASK